MVILPSLQQLCFLCALAEQCHFGRAAESCAVMQSTLSGGIKELEARLGVPLFERSHRHVMLTPLGKEIATRAQRLLVDAEELVGGAVGAGGGRALLAELFGAGMSDRGSGSQ